MIAGGGVRKITIKEIRVQDFVRGKALNAVWTFRMGYKAGQVRIITVEQEGNNFKEDGRCLSLVPDSTEFPASVVALISFYFFFQLSIINCQLSINNSSGQFDGLNGFSNVMYS